MISQEGRQPVIEKSLAGLSETEIEDMNRKRAWVAGFPQFFGDANTVDGKLQLIDAVLTDDKAVAGGAFTLQALGIVLGDAIGQETGMKWYMLESNIGRGPCLGLMGTSLKLLPVNVFADEIAAGRKPRARDVFDFFINRLAELKADLPK